uniref:Uncharacterized protein n=1 Tax=Romanomermis culicivorax TaxID=13658 RepID=A0A915I1R7_ROMCU
MKAIKPSSFLIICKPRPRCPRCCCRRPKQPSIVIRIAPTLSHAAYCNHRPYLDKVRHSDANVLCSVINIYFG